MMSHLTPVDFSDVWVIFTKRGTKPPKEWTKCYFYSSQKLKDIAHTNLRKYIHFVGEGYLDDPEDFTQEKMVAEVLQKFAEEWRINKMVVSTLQHTVPIMTIPLDCHLLFIRS